MMPTKKLRAGEVINVDPQIIKWRKLMRKKALKIPCLKTSKELEKARRKLERKRATMRGLQHKNFFE